MQRDDPEPFDPAPLLESLAAEGIDFVVIGGVAGGAHGSAYGTADIDVAYARSPGNLKRLANALEALGVDQRSLNRAEAFTVPTRLGSLDAFANPIGAPPYARLRADAVIVEIGSQRVRVASLDHLIAMKAAGARIRDELLGTEYRVLSDELRAPRDP